MSDLRKTILERGFAHNEECDKFNKEWQRKANISEEPGELNGEGVWIQLLSEEDVKLYDSDSETGKEINGVMLNHSFQLNGPSWGLVITFKHNGASRPSVCIADVLEQIKPRADEYFKYFDSITKEDNEDGEQS